MPTRVYIVEDHEVVRRTLRTFVDAVQDFEVVGAAETAEEALEAVEQMAPDLLILDVALPGRSGLDLLEDVQARWGTPCVMLSGHREAAYVSRALRSGAMGYVVKGAPAELEAALRKAIAGERYLSPSLSWPDDMDGT